MVALGDITGFTDFTLRVRKPDEEYLPIMDYFDGLIERLVRHPSRDINNNTGDGFAVFETLKKGDEKKQSLALIKELWDLTQSMNDMIRRAPWPRPEGFRIRMATGYVWKKEASPLPIYRGPDINMVSRLLRVERKRDFVVHGSFRDLISQEEIEKLGLHYQKVKPPKLVPDGLLKQELLELWEVIKL